MSPHPPTCGTPGRGARKGIVFATASCKLVTWTLAASLLAPALAAGAGAPTPPSESQGPLWLPVPERMRVPRAAAKLMPNRDRAAEITSAAAAWGLGPEAELSFHTPVAGGPPGAIYNLGPAGGAAPGGDASAAARRSSRRSPRSTC